MVPDDITKRKRHLLYKYSSIKCLWYKAIKISHCRYVQIIYKLHSPIEANKMCWQTLEIPATGRWRQEYQELNSSLGDMVNLKQPGRHDNQGNKTN